MKKIILPFLFLVTTLSMPIQAQNKSKSIPQRPALVVGIVVDQMRYDYLNKYSNRYSEGGFKRLMREGLNCQDNHYNYAPTVTAAGHASVYTGSVPAIHGIVGNEWTDPKTGKKVYCTEDSTVKTVGTTGNTGWMSPKNLWTSTITDQLKIAQNFKSKTIAVAIKDRGAILLYFLFQ
jgi:predicted AlkP superfamily pyrophosphatase or phosphodiesterase